MIKNIEVLYELQNEINKFGFIYDDVDMEMQMEGIDIHDLINTGNQDLCDLLNNLNKIDYLLSLLTVDIKESISEEGFDTNDFHRWNQEMFYDVHRIEGLIETFEGALECLEFYVQETIRGYQILEQIASDGEFVAEKQEE